MIRPNQIRNKAIRWYEHTLRLWLKGDSFEPLRIPIGKLPSEAGAYYAAIHHLRCGEKTDERPGYTLETKTIKKRALGMQTVPLALHFASERDLLGYLGKEREFTLFQEDVRRIRQQLPQLEGWLYRFPRRVIAYHEQWPTLLMIGCYFLEHPFPGISTREIPLPLPTKYIETHQLMIREVLDHLLPAEAIIPEASQFHQRFGLQKNEAEFSLRFLDLQLQGQAGFPCEYVSLPVSHLGQLQIPPCRCLISENKRPFVRMPARPETLLLLGSGSQAASLRHVAWLHACSLWYWGDLDARGFEILSRLRQAFPSLRSLCMDEETLQTFQKYVVAGSGRTQKKLLYLSEAEQDLYRFLVKNNLCLEQEHLSLSYISQKFDLSIRGVSISK